MSFHGYPSTIANFSNLIINNGLTDIYKALKLKCITVGSEIYQLVKKINREHFQLQRI